MMNLPPTLTTGFGRTDANISTAPQYLQNLTVQYLDRCDSAYQFYSEEAHLCVVYPPKSGPCFDQSAPVYYCDSTSKCYVAGLLSHVITGENDASICTGDLPDVFTRLSSYYDWLYERNCLYSANPPDACATLTYSTIVCPWDEAESTFGDNNGCGNRIYQTFSGWTSQVGRSISSLWSP